MEDLNFSFVMIYIIHKLLVFLKDTIFKCFFKEYNRLFFFNNFFSQNIMMESLSL